MLYSAPLKYLLKVGGEVLSTTAQTLSGAVNELKTALSSLAAVARSGSYNDLLDLPTLATVATSGSYGDLSDQPTLGTAASKDVPASGNASNTQVVLGNDSRLSDARTPTSHTHTKAQITDFSHTHTKSQITDFSHTHNYAGSPSAGGDANNALKLNGYASDTAASANTIVRRQANGYIFAVYYNQSSGSETATASSYVIFCNADGYFRKTPMSTIKSLVDTNTNTWRGFQFLRRTASATISKNSNKTVTFSGLNNVSGYAPRVAFFETCTGTGQTWVIPENAIKLCGDGSCSFNCRNFSSSDVTVTVQILVLYTQ